MNEVLKKLEAALTEIITNYSSCHVLWYNPQDDKWIKQHCTNNELVDLIIYLTYNKKCGVVVIKYGAQGQKTIVQHDGRLYLSKENR